MDMSLWWSIAPMVLVSGFGIAAVVFARLTDELDHLDQALVRLERTGVGVDELRRDVAMVRAKVEANGVRHKSAPVDR